jgi:RNA polymerase sigma factor (sigma-70 family)
MAPLDLNTKHRIIRDLSEYVIHYYTSDLFAVFQPKIDRLVYNYLRKLPHFIKESERDDLSNIACIEFLETLRSWDPTTHAMIWPFAFSRINGAMRDHIRYLTKADPSRIYSWVTDAAYIYLAINKNQTEFAGKIEDGLMLKQAMELLSATEQKVITLKGVHDLTLKDISVKVNLSESQVSRIYNGAIDKLKKILKGGR